MIVRLLYTLILYMLAPLFLWRLLRSEPGKPSIGARWPELLGFTPQISSSKNQYIIWIHAVSLGETISVSPVIQRLNDEYPNAKLIITTTTPTGAQEAQKLKNISEHRYMPIDIPFAVKKFIKTVKPTHLVIMETELWPNLLMAANRNHINVSLINARLSEKSYINYTKLSWLIIPALKTLKHVYCQTESDKFRFENLGVDPSKISITGSIKFDIDIPEDTYNKSKMLRDELGKERPVWIAASTHEGEDQILLDTHKKILEIFPNALLILVPRHPERFHDVFNLSLKNNLNIIKRSSRIGVTTEPVYLADTMGEMLVLLGSADVCFMGGSLIGKKVGGHNVLEPASMGVPTVIGPSYYNFKDITLALAEQEALTIIYEPTQIAPNIIRLLTDNQLNKMVSSKAISFVESNKGAIDKTIQSLID